MRFKSKTVAFFIVLLLAIPSTAAAWQGKVVGVSDGDTITVMHNGRGEKIRLYGVDCPESHQDFGQKAKQFTSGMVFGKVYCVKVTCVIKLSKITYDYGLLLVGA